jgi:transcriptional regulator with XRE-family HTH domain
VISLDEIGRMIRDKREADGLTRWDIADRAGVGETTVAYIERGERNVGWLTLQYVLVAAGLRLTCSVDGDNRSDP